MSHSPTPPIEPDAEWFRTLAENARFAVFVYHKNRLLYTNPAASELTGFERERLQRMAPRDLIDPRFRDAVPRPGDPGEGLGTPIELRIVRAGGEPRWIALSLSPIDFPDLDAWLGTAIDIGERKQAEEALRRRLELENVLADISHRFLQTEPEDLTDGIASALGRLGTAANAGRAFLAVTTPAGGELLVGDEWCAADVAPLRRHAEPCPVCSLAPVGRRLGRGEPIAIPDVGAPPAWLGRALGEPPPALPRSFICSPVFLGGELYGAVGLEEPEAIRTWTSEELQLLRIGGDTIGAAVHRCRTELELRASREWLELAQRAGRSVAWEWHPGDDSMTLSASAPAVFGFAPELLPKSGAELMRHIPEEDRERITALFRSVFKTGERYAVEHRVVTPEGRTLWLTVKGQALREPGGRVARVVGVSADISDRKRVELELREEKERALVTLSSIGDGVIRTDAEGRVDFVNPAAERLIGLDVKAALACPIDEVYQVLDEAGTRARGNPVSACLDEGRPVESSGVGLLVRPDGSQVVVRDVAAPIRQPEGGLGGAVLVFRDVTRLRQLEREMAYLATHDPLTGLLNRHELEERLREAITEAEAGEVEHALCYLDLDDFKVVNDTCGHVAGDELLRQLTSVLSSAMRPEDTLARLGGDEFGLLLRRCTLVEARERADGVLDAVKRYRFFWGDQVFQLGASIGIVRVAGAGSSLGELFSAVDAACYVAKDRGRNQVHVSEPDDAEIASRYNEMRWVQRINLAFEEGRFHLFKQPIHALKGGEPTPLAEILLRLIDEQGALVSPELFIAAAERYRIMPALDRWVVDVALQAIGQLHLRPGREEECFTINLSGQTLGDPTILTFTLERLRANRVPPQAICFEITETAAISNLTKARSFIEALKGNGCRFILDDFGTGLSSFAYLKNLPVDLIKIDGALVRGLENDPVQREMVASIHRIARVMQVETIAECVETPEALAALSEIGIDFAQGYLLEAPSPLLVHP